MNLQYSRMWLNINNKQLYIAEECDLCDPIAWRFPRLSWSDIRWLNHDVMAHEIYKEALLHMEAHKAFCKILELLRALLYRLCAAHF